jgi:MATE family multidrug resistance protein
MINFFKNINRQYHTVGGYADFLRIAVPLIISMGVNAIQIFIDRVFLSYYSQVSYAAAIPAGISNFAIMSIFLFTLGYIDIFVAQYYGKQENSSIGPAVWQSVYLALAAAFLIFLVSLFSEKIFTHIGHPYNVAVEEVKYFKMLCYGAFPTIADLALSGFYSGRGKTKVVLLITTCCITVNILLDFCLIFGNLGFPELGITGAALATNISAAISVLISIILILQKKNNAIYNTRKFTPDFVFMKRLLRYGFPNGIATFFDMAEFSIFTLIVGTIGTVELTASNIAVSIYDIIVMPIIGCGMATSIMVGQYLGRNKASIAATCIKSAFHIIYAYVIILAILLILAPNLIIFPFTIGAQASSANTIMPVTLNILKIIVIHLLLEPWYTIFGAIIKGAGDTAYAMKALAFASIFLIIIPAYMFIVIFKFEIYTAWLCMLSFIIFLSVSYYLRYKSGKWKRMRVIEMDIIDG